MKVVAVKTHKITKGDKSIFEVLNKYIPSLKDKSVVTVASKIVAIAEGRLVRKTSETQKDELAAKEAEYYLPREENKYGFLITVKHNLLVASAGIDESNGNGYLVLWPEDPQKSANMIREYLVKKHKVKKVGVIITDSKLTPLRWGVTGYAIASSGFRVLNSYIGKPDIFGRLMHAEKLNLADSLAASAVAVTGEGKEQTPIAIIEDVPFVTFQKRNPTDAEIKGLRIKLKDDVFYPLLKSVKWSSEAEDQKKRKNNKHAKKD